MTSVLSGYPDADAFNSPLEDEYKYNFLEKKNTQNLSLLSSLLLRFFTKPKRNVCVCLSLVCSKHSFLYLTCQHYKILGLLCRIILSWVSIVFFFSNLFLYYSVYILRFIGKNVMFAQFVTYLIII